MKRSDSDSSNDIVDVERRIAQITKDAHGDDEQLRAFHQAIQDGVDLPCDAFIIGEPISVVAFDYDGNRRRGIVVRCRREDGSEHVVAASEVALAPRSRGGPILAAYRGWLGLDPLPDQAASPPRRKRQHKVAATDLDLSQPMELIVLSTKERAARCRFRVPTAS